MTRGIVYVISNPSMPGMVKIGRTTRDADLRAAELWQTGVPSPFYVWESFGTHDCVALEKLVHHDLRKHRVNASREFFNIEPDEALRVLRFWSAVQADLLLSDYGFEASACTTSDAVLAYDTKAEAQKLGVDPEHLIAALRFIPRQVLGDALVLAKSSAEAACDYDAVGIPDCDAS